MGKFGSRKSLEKSISKAMKSNSRKDKKAKEKKLIEENENKKTDGSKNRKKPDQLKPGMTVSGVFSYSGSGYGFCRPLEGSGFNEEIYIPEDGMRKASGAVTGDIIEVRITEAAHTDFGYYGDVFYRKASGEVQRIVEHKVTSIIGVLHVGSSRACVEPDIKSIKTMIRVDFSSVSEKYDGYKVAVVPEEGPYFERKSSTWEDYGIELRGKIERIFGSSLSKDGAYEATLYENRIRTVFPDSVLRSASEAAEKYCEPKGRADLRDKIIFTIDGEDAKDLDDAISLEITDKGYVLGVHIADVSNYVRQGTPVEEEARLRGTSVYFVDKVVPMLPEVLSNGVCSLNSGEDKLSMTAEITLDDNLNMTDVKIFKSVVRSRVRGVYSEINALWKAGKRSRFYKKYSEVYDTLAEMKKLYLRLQKASEERFVMEIEDDEVNITVDSEGKPVMIERRERGDAEKMIEQFMLQANIAVAETLKRLSLPCIYRIHESPSEEKTLNFIKYASAIGIKTHGLRKSFDAETKEEEADRIAEAYTEILKSAKESGISDIVSGVMLRSMMKAKYSKACAPHFGLRVKTYCHFTSPIRRYPDLYVHSVITEALRHINPGTRKYPQISFHTRDGISEKTDEYFERNADERAVMSTDAEMRAVNAERKIESIYKAIYMSDKIGQKFPAKIVSVINTGFFVRLDNYIEGFVSDLRNGCDVDAERMTVSFHFYNIKEKTIGSDIEVILVNADISKGQLDFNIVVPNVEKKKSGRKERTTKRK